VVRIAQHWGFRLFVAHSGGPWLCLLTSAATLARTRRRYRYARRRCAAASRSDTCFGRDPRALSYLLYRDTATDLTFALVAVLWTLIAVAAALSAVAAMAPLSLWMGAARSLGLTWPYAAGGGPWSAPAPCNWPRNSGARPLPFTFELVRHLLTPILPTLHADLGQALVEHRPLRRADCGSLLGSRGCGSDAGVFRCVAVVLSARIYFSARFAAHSGRVGGNFHSQCVFALRR